MNVGARADKTF